MSERLAARLALEATGEVARHVAPLTGGQVGQVWRVDTPSRSLVAKFVGAGEDPPFADEAVDNRVYGARWSNLAPAHEALATRGVRAPAVYAMGEAEGLNYAVMDYLAGDPDDHSPAWFAAVGRALGQVHGISRRYQGWVGMAAPLADDWSTAFGNSLGNRLREAAPLLGPDLHDAVAARAGGELARLRNPPAFVLSHTDGFQGVMRRTGEDWACVGHIDIEDFQFTDQRFVLAGFELSHAFAGRPVPGDFWDAYLETVDLVPGYRRVRDLFQTYYLLVWARVLRDQAPLFETCLRRLEALVS